MTNRNFKNSGLRVLEAPNGDLCITDKGGREWWKGKGDTLFLNAEVMEQAYNDDKIAGTLLRRLSDFIKAHRRARSQWHDVPQTTAQAGEEAQAGGAETQGQGVAE